MTRNGRPTPWREYLAVEAQVETCPMNGATPCRYCRRDLRAARTRLALSAVAHVGVAVAAAGALFLALALAIAAFSPVPATHAVTTQHTAPRSIAQAAPKPPAPIRLAVIGDSISAWSPPFSGNLAQSWVMTATSNDVPLVGGWAYPGATIAAMRAHLTPAPDVDVLVLLVGTNDVYQGTPVAQRLDDIDAMAATIHAKHVIVSATPPFGYDYALGTAWNAILSNHAAAQGWSYVDPWAGVRQPDGHWWPGTDYGDHVHPNPATAAYVGGILHDAIVTAARGAQLPTI